MPPVETLRPRPSIKMTVEIIGPSEQIVDQAYALLAQYDERGAYTLLHTSLMQAMVASMSQVCDHLVQDIIASRLAYWAMRQ